MKFYLCEILNSVSPAIITILLGNILEPVGKTSVAFLNESIQVRSAAPPIAIIQCNDGTIPNQHSIAKTSNAGKSHDEAIIMPVNPMKISDDFLLQHKERMIVYQPSAMMHKDDKKPP